VSLKDGGFGIVVELPKDVDVVGEEKVLELFVDGDVLKLLLLYEVGV
jgi:hypothetical protein